MIPHNDMVFKVQRPLQVPNTEGDAFWLIYDKTRSFEFLGKPTKQLRDLMGEDVKMYVLAKLVPVPNGEGYSFEISKRLADEHVPLW